jgi:hypothetical protein
MASSQFVQSVDNRLDEVSRISFVPQVRRIAGGPRDPMLPQHTLACTRFG